MEPKRTFKREDLYNLIWSTPISKVAESVGISDRGWAKICARHQIAVPGRGYWAKIEAGQPATRTPLWKFDNPSLDIVHIGGTKQHANPYVASAVAAAQKAVAEAILKPTVAPRTGQRSTKVADNNTPVTFAPVGRPHLSVSGLVLELKAAQPDRDGQLSMPGIRIHRASRARVIAFLHHLAIALERRQIALIQGERRLKATIPPEDVSFEITEGLRRIKHEPTASEMKKKQGHERKREAAC